jgi:hypothetical protein
MGWLSPENRRTPAAATPYARRPEASSAASLRDRIRASRPVDGLRRRIRGDSAAADPGCASVGDDGSGRLSPLPVPASGIRTLRIAGGPSASAVLTDVTAVRDATALSALGVDGRVSEGAAVSLTEWVRTRPGVDRIRFGYGPLPPAAAIALCRGGGSAVRTYRELSLILSPASTAAMGTAGVHPSAKRLFLGYCDRPAAAGTEAARCRFWRSVAVDRNIRTLILDGARTNGNPGEGIDSVWRRLRYDAMPERVVVVRNADRWERSHWEFLMPTEGLVCLHHRVAVATGSPPPDMPWIPGVLGRAPAWGIRRPNPARFYVFVERGDDRSSTADATDRMAWLLKLFKAVAYRVDMTDAEGFEMRVMHDPDPATSERRWKTPESATKKRFRVTFHADDAGEAAWGRDPLPCESL